MVSGTNRVGVARWWDKGWHRALRLHYAGTTEKDQRRAPIAAVASMQAENRYRREFYKYVTNKDKEARRG